MNLKNVRKISVNKVLECYKNLDIDKNVLYTHPVCNIFHVHIKFNEHFRIYPLTMGTGRILTEEINMSGYKVPAGVSNIPTKA